MIGAQDQQRPGEADKALTRGERANLVMRAELGDWKQKLALIILDQFAGQNAGCWPRMSTIAKCMNCHRRTARAAVSLLAARGIVRYKDRLLGLASRRYTIEYGVLADLQSIAPPRHEAPTPPARGAYPLGTRRPPPRHEAPTYNKQTTATRTVTEHSGRAAAVPGSVPEDVQSRSGVAQRQDQEAEKAAKHAQHRIRARLRAIALLSGNRVWGRSITALVEIAARGNDGNPLPRVMEVIEMADAAKPTDRGAWIKEAIEQDWRTAEQGARP